MVAKDSRDPIERMVDAYEKMLERVNQMLDKAEKNTLPTLGKALDHAREKAVELNELTREEAERLSEYLERDMKDAARYLSETGTEFRTWWRFDIELIEQRLLELFASVADKTKLELEGLAEQARDAAFYSTGEITGPGTLVCTDCGKILSFHKAGYIPPCPKCFKTKYRRATGDIS